MRVLVLGGTRFLGRRVTERLHARGDQVLLVHRGRHEPHPWLPVAHLRTDRRELAAHAERVREFAPQAVVDTSALTGSDVDAVLPVLPRVPVVVLSSQDVYEAFAALRAGRHHSDGPLTEDSPVRAERYPYRGLGYDSIPEDYEKLDVEQRWLDRGAVVLRLPLSYGPHDWQRREDVVLRRLRAGRRSIPVGPGELLWTRGHAEDLATGVLAALDRRAADGMVLNLGETGTPPLRQWFEQIVAAAGSDARLVRVADEVLPPDLALTAQQPQHLLVSVERARAVLGWNPGQPATRVAESVRWHLAHPPEASWTDADTAADEAALAHR